MARRFNVPVSLDAAAPAGASVAYALTTAGSGGTAGAASDLTGGFASGRVAISQGQTTAPLLLGIADAGVAGHLIDVTLSDPLPAGSTIKAGAGSTRLTIPAASGGGGATPGMLLVGDVADSTVARSLTTRPLRGQALFRDGIEDLRGIYVIVGGVDAQNYIRFFLRINQDASYAKMIVENISGGTVNPTGFSNVDLPLTATNVIVGVQINADRSVTVIQRTQAGVETTLFTISAASVDQNFPQPWGDIVQLIRHEGPMMKQVSTGTPA